MPGNHQTKSKLFIAYMATTLLAACASGPPAPVIEIPLEVSRAQQEQATGNFSEAAELWQEAALVTVGPEQHQYRLQAAEAWLRAGENSRSASLLEQVDKRQLRQDRVSRYSLLNAELALAVSDGETAEIYLASAQQNLTASQQSRYQTLLARARRLQADPANFALATAASAMRSPGVYDSTRGVAILQLLEDVPSSSLRSISNEAAKAYGLDSWPELTLLVRETLVSGRDVTQAALNWANEHPEHVVTELEFAKLAGRYRALFSLPRNIAVLLPVNGSLAAAGKAIRDGFVSAHLNRPENVSLRFYDTGEDPQSAVSAYFQAIDEGAQWIVGPLRKESVEAVSNLGSHGVPAIVLNSSNSGEMQANKDSLLFSVSLSQEQEARAIAKRALKNGQNAAIMVTVNSTWGNRMELAFAEAFIAGGGTITTSSQFNTSENDHSGLLKELLKINESDDRKNRVQATIGTTLNFEPFRRDDFDLFFLAASPVQGRQLRPQLKFHDAGEIPVYAMSRIYSGSVDRSTDQDLNGVYFPSTHIQLSPSGGNTSGEFESMREGSFSALHALGRDAWNLLPWLPLMQKDQDLQFPGAVGFLSMSRNGELERDPVWAQFSRGRPVAASWPENTNQDE
jgi:outer membrane PBP1 activator LpoA protein